MIFDDGRAPPGTQKKKRLKSKQNCPLCYGRGTLVYSFPGKDGNKKTSLIYCRCVKYVDAE